MYEISQTSGLSIPIPNALVAIMALISFLLNFDRIRSLLLDSVSPVYVSTSGVSKVSVRVGLM